MSSVLNSYIKLIKIIATNGIDQNNAIVDNDEQQDDKEEKKERKRINTRNSEKKQNRLKEL